MSARLWWHAVRGLVLAFASIAAAEQARPRAPQNGSVLFVCEHGNVKSLIAREWFNRLAAQRGLVLRAVSRGLKPETSVPPGIAEALRNDGFDVSRFQAQAFSAADAVGAARVIGIGVDLAPVAGRVPAPLDTWHGIPPASEDYAASRDALRARIEALLKTFEDAERRR